MSNTYRKDSNNKSYKESLKKKFARYKCRCERCVGKNSEVYKIAEKDLKKEMILIHKEGVDHDCPIQDEILKQVFNRE